LDDTTLSLSLPRIHAIVHRKISTYHVGLHGGALSSQLVGLVFSIRGVFPVVDASGAGVSVAGAEAYELRFRPMTALAKA